MGDVLTHPFFYFIDKIKSEPFSTRFSKQYYTGSYSQELVPSPEYDNIERIQIEFFRNVFIILFTFHSVFVKKGIPWTSVTVSAVQSSPA